MNKKSVRNRPRFPRNIPTIWDVNDFLAQIRTHERKNLFRYYEGKELCSMSYEDFAVLVERCAAGFAAMGLSGKRIALIGNTSPQWLASYLGAIAAGSVIIPMDKELALTEIDGFLRMAEAEAIVYSASFDAGFASMKGTHPTLRHFICIGATSVGSETMSFDAMIDTGRAAWASGWRIPRKFNLEQMCEMLFTSGTTGTSKCVMLCQKNIFSTVTAAINSVCFVYDDVILSVLPVHHTYELMCLMGEMLIGCEICINDSLRHIMKNMTLFRPTVMVLVPLIVQTMYKKIWSEVEKKNMTKKLRLAISLSEGARRVGVDLRRKLFAQVLDAFGGRLDNIICGGARLDPALIYGFEELGIMICQGFGITECSPLTAVERYYDRHPGSVGQAVQSCRMRIAPNGETTDEGYALGEIQVRGENVMLGYYKNPEANEEVFTDDGWFRTGDIGYVDRDGCYTITGRSKFVIVLENGKNVFPEEIEEALGSIEEISESVVVGRKTPDGEQINLTAVVFPDYSRFPEGVSDQEVNDVIRSRVSELNKELASFKRIKAVEIRKTEFEKTTTKKIKRQLIR